MTGSTGGDMTEFNSQAYSGDRRKPSTRRLRAVPEAPSEAGDSNFSGESPSASGDIERRAYERYEARGREHGHDLQDWLEAEQEMNQRRTATGDGD
jgi:hypothetical protein